MDKQEELNELESKRLELDARRAASDRAALDYVKSLPGFRAAYPEHAAEIDAVEAEEQTVDESIDEVKTEWELHLGEWVDIGDIVVKDGVRYVVLQGHTLQADWVPGEVPSLYRLEADPGDEWPEWVQPTGAHDCYNKGDKVTFEGKHYVSLIDNNSWSPAVYPQGWELHE